MHHHHYAVLRLLDVHLHIVGLLLDGLAEGGERVLGSLEGRASVRDDQNRLAVVGRNEHQQAHPDGGYDRGRDDPRRRAPREPDVAPLRHPGRGHRRTGIAEVVVDPVQQERDGGGAEDPGRQPEQPPQERQAHHEEEQQAHGARKEGRDLPPEQFDQPRRDIGEHRRGDGPRGEGQGDGPPVPHRTLGALPEGAARAHALEEHERQGQDPSADHPEHERGEPREDEAGEGDGDPEHGRLAGQVEVDVVVVQEEPVDGSDGEDEGRREEQDPPHNVKGQAQDGLGLDGPEGEGPRHPQARALLPREPDPHEAGHLQDGDRDEQGAADEERHQAPGRVHEEEQDVRVREGGRVGPHHEPPDEEGRGRG